MLCHALTKDCGVRISNSICLTDSTRMYEDWFQCDICYDQYDLVLTTLNFLSGAMVARNVERLY